MIADCFKRFDAFLRLQSVFCLDFDRWRAGSKLNAGVIPWSIDLARDSRRRIVGERNPPKLRFRQYGNEDVRNDARLIVGTGKGAITAHVVLRSELNLPLDEMVHRIFHLTAKEWGCMGSVSDAGHSRRACTSGGVPDATRPAVL